MAIQTTEAFILNRKDFRDTSVLATFYSKDFGKVKGILKGIRGERTRYGGRADLFSLNKIVFYERSRGEFNNVTQCDLMDGLFGLRKSLTAIACASYICELVDAMTEPGENNPEVYELLRRMLGLLASGGEPRNLVRIFELRLLSYLGFAPSFGSCISCRDSVYGKGRFSLRHEGLLCERCSKEDPGAKAVSKGTVQTLNHIENSRLPSLLKFKISRAIEGEMDELVGALLQRHVERPLKSKKFLREVQRLGQ